MARTPRCRRIRCCPDYWSFAPQDEGQAEVVEMTLDELIEPAKMQVVVLELEEERR